MTRLKFNKRNLFFLIIFCLLFSFTLLVLNKNSVFADETQTQKEFEEANSNSAFTKEDADKATVENIINTLNIAVSGPETTALKNDGGAIGQIGGLIAYAIGNPPVSTGEYLADLGSNLGLPIKSAYAQGTGWQALKPVLPIWKAFRNVSYIAFVIIFVVIGFMIMFRAKINPQTVISIQSALPKIIITLLLVTFSYAIAGLMIDLIYILIYLFVGVAQLGGLIEKTQPALDLLLKENPFGLVFNTNKGADIFIQGPGNAIQNLITGFFGAWLSDTGLAKIVGGLSKLVISVAILVSLYKLFFSLLLSYIAIVIAVIFAPFNILFNALPGSNAFMGWLKNLFANVIVFPAVAGMFLIAAILIGPRNSAPCGDKNNTWCIEQGIGYYPQTEKNNEVWVPPLLNVHHKGGGGDVNTFQALIALGLIMMMPQVVTMIKKMLKVESSGFGPAVMGGIMVGPQILGGVGKIGYGGYMQINQFAYQRAQKKNWQENRNKQESS